MKKAFKASRQYLGKPRVKLWLCGIGIIVAMSVIAATPPLTRNLAVIPQNAAAQNRLAKQPSTLSLTTAGNSGQNTDGSSSGSVSAASQNEPAPAPVSEPTVIEPVFPPPYKYCKLPIYKYVNPCQPYCDPSIDIAGCCGPPLEDIVCAMP